MNKPIYGSEESVVHLTVPERDFLASFVEAQKIRLFDVSQSAQNSEFMREQTRIISGLEKKLVAF